MLFIMKDSPQKQFIFKLAIIVPILNGADAISAWLRQFKCTFVHFNGVSVKLSLWIIDGVSNDRVALLNAVKKEMVNPPRLSVFVFAMDHLDSAGHFVPLLQSHSADYPQVDAEQVFAGLTTSHLRSGRGFQLRLGALLAQKAADWYFFVHVDTRFNDKLDSRNPIEILSDMAQQASPSVAGFYGHLRFDAKGFWPWWVAAWANIRSVFFALPYGDQGLFIRAKDYLASGGYAPVVLMEDVDIALKFRRKLRRMPLIAMTSAVRYQKHGWLRRGLRNIKVLIFYFCGLSEEKLMHIYRK